MLQIIKELSLLENITIIGNINHNPGITIKSINDIIFIDES